MSKRDKNTRPNMTIKSKAKHKEPKTSTPEPVRPPESPCHDDSNSFCGSDGASPIQFFCTQDGARGENEVIWNYYTPKSDNSSKNSRKSISKKNKKRNNVRMDLANLEEDIERKFLRPVQRKTQLLDSLKAELLELNELIVKNKSSEQLRSPTPNESDDDLFSTMTDSPKSALDCVQKPDRRCLRKNLLSSKFNRTDVDNALESDDSMNEHLIIASQILEEKGDAPTPPKIQFLAPQKRKSSSFTTKAKIVQDLTNDSFENLLTNMIDSDIEKLSQVPVKQSPKLSKFSPKTVQQTSAWSVKKSSMNTVPSPGGSFSRTSSMPESPKVSLVAKTSTNHVALSRHSSMPYSNKDKTALNLDSSSPFKCTQDEIKRKHQQAKEKLLAKRTLPFTKTQSSSQKENGVSTFGLNNIQKNLNHIAEQNKCDNSLKALIERKRIEALMKLQKKRAMCS